MKNKIVVSDLFFDIFQNFNVFNQVSSMKQLSNEELFLLLDACIDHHDMEDSIVIGNFSPFKTELSEILLIQNGKKTNNIDLANLIEKTDPILSSQIFDSNGLSLPNPYTREEVRNLKLNKIFEK
jgi:hypothetical protein